MSKARDSETIFYQSLLIYRTTPLECGVSPAQLLIGPRLRSNLPIQNDLLKTKEANTVKKIKEQQKAKQKFYYDRGTKNLPELQAGDQVRFKDKTNTWTKVLSEVQPRSYTIQTEEGALLRHNQRDLLKETPTIEQRFEAAEQPHHTPETLT